MVSKFLYRFIPTTFKVLKTIDKIDFEKRNGIIPVIVQDVKTKDILMLGYANKLALHKTVETGNAHFWSTSHNKLWMKGEESGNIQPVEKILVDCDSDALLYLVNSLNPACHTGDRTCFHNELASYDYCLTDS
jgi:phosphoribosyl-AMP cyclohydrolase